MTTIKNIRIAKTVRNIVVSPKIKDIVAKYLEKKWWNVSPTERLFGLTYELNRIDGSYIGYRPGIKAHEYICKPEYDRLIIYAENEEKEIKIIVANVETVGDINQYLCELNSRGYGKKLRFYEIFSIYSSKSPYVDEEGIEEYLECICTSDNMSVNLQSADLVCRC